MKKILFIFLALPLISLAQSTELDETTYDFWLGKWNAEWQQADGTVGTGTNYIFKVLDGKVLEENFEVTGGAQKGYKGKSLSVFNPVNKSWHQAWADNQGGYIDFDGEVDGERKIFKTKPVENEGNLSYQRMVFYDVKKDSFSWDWEGTKDNGETWNLLWRIKYTRVN